MGPRPDGRGKVVAVICIAGAALRQWGRGQTAAESGGRLRYDACLQASVNGAAARRPRKVVTAPTTAGYNQRQWGRGQTAAESPGTNVVNYRVI